MLDSAVIGGLTLDDIVGRDGSIHRRTAGGNALYAALGARVWSERVGIVSFVGEDYPASALQQIEEAGVELALVARRPGASIRLWILYELDGSRQISYQTDSASLLELAGCIDEAAPALDGALSPDAAVHVAALPVALQRPVVDALRPLGRTLTLDSIEASGSVGGDLVSYRDPAVFAGVSAFLPSEAELEVVLADGRSLWEIGAGHLRWIAVKRGAAGSELVDLAARTRRLLPALEVEEVDPTGAGDAFCGGFLAGLRQTGDPFEAALRGTVSASFAVEAPGALHLCDVEPREVALRLRTLRATVMLDEEVAWCAGRT